MNSFYRYVDHKGDTITRALIEEPTPWNWGKCASNQFEMCNKIFVTLRQAGHQGTAIEHYCFDRAVHTAMTKLFFASHQISAKHRRLLQDGSNAEEDFIEDLTEWKIDTPCAAHDAQNSFKWALWEEDYSKENLKDAHISIQSLRNSMNILQGHVGRWVANIISFIPDRTFAVVDEMRAVWDTPVRNDAETVELVSVILQIRFNCIAQRLEIAESARSLPDLIGAIVSTLMSVWQFRQFTDSRWLTVGDAGRTIAAGLLTGLDSLVDEIKCAPHVSLFHLGGLAGDVKGFLIEASIVSRPMDAVLALLMEDGRVAQRYEELTELVQEEMRWMINLPGLVWNLVGELVSRGGAQLRSRCLRAGHESVAQFSKRVLDVVACRPWSLCRGDVDAKVDELAAEEEPPVTDDVSRKIWQLCRMGFSKVQIRKGVALLSNSPWTTLPTEQFHGSAASLMRLRPECSASTLRCRAFIISLSRLMPRPSAEEKSVAALQKKLEALQRRQPEKAGGRHLYLKDIMDLAREKTNRFGAHKANWQKQIFKRHASIWAGAASRHPDANRGGSDRAGAATIPSS
ncbi:unnamed protein product [Polarella glacialis]|uniref:Uncharacterized protein n=1 Tax=Polarella glacialis TaxID=89957 RepID=A0A813K930_POLGL|nr:unnamed protein product [Polarella glacialis]